MAENRGKQFEDKFRSDWKKSFPDGIIIRLADQMSGYKVYSKNICDFICFTNRKLFLIECKTHHGASIPLVNITQFDIMIKYSGYENVRCGVIIWLIDKDVVFYIPVQQIKQMKDEGLKSINIKHVENLNFHIKKLPSIKKRVFMDTDYTELLNLEEGD